MRLHPHINFGGQCRDAFLFYERILGATIRTLRTWGETPMASETPREWHEKISHAALIVGTDEMLGFDDPQEPDAKLKGFQMLLDIEENGEAARLFEALADGGTVIMPMQKTFWTVGFGVVVDRFGVQWEINCAQA